MPPALRLPAAVLALALTVLWAEDAHASGFFVPADAGEADAWSVESLDVDAIVGGAHARVTVTQVLRNAGDRPLVGTWIFPLLRGESITAPTLHEGAEVLPGAVLAADAARAGYLALVARQRDPGLLRWLGHDLFRVDGVTLPAGGTRKLVLTYEQDVGAAVGASTFAYPLSAAALSPSPVSHATVRVDVQAKLPIGPIYSPTHDLDVQRMGPERAVLRWEGDLAGDAHDLLLLWSTTSRRVGAALLTHWPAGEDAGWFLLVAEARALAAGAPRPKQITFVVDVSGSMAGEKLEQVRAALVRVVGGLAEADRFNVIAYHEEVHALWPAPRLADPEARAEALAFLDRLKASGGTNIGEALEAALAPERGPTLPAEVLFLTDGRPTAGELSPDRILARVRERNLAPAARIFVLGVGVDVDTVFLDRLALENHGTPAYVRPRESVEAKVAAIYARVRDPVLVDLTLDAQGLDAFEVLPRSLPDLYQGAPLVVAGRYRRGGSVPLVLTGRDGSYLQEFHSSQRAARRGESTQGDVPARVWAMRRIARLVDAIRLGGDDAEQAVDPLVELSTRFGILTEYTAFLADESGVSHAAHRINAQRARTLLHELVGRAVGGAGLAQAANQGERRGAGRVRPGTGAWFATPDDRDVRRVDLRGVRQVAGRTFYYRGERVGWVDVQVGEGREPDEVVARWSPRFLALLAATTPEENARLALAGPLLLEVQGRILKVVDPS